MFLFLWLFALNSFPFLPYWDFCLFEKEEQRKKRRRVVSLLSWLWPLQGKLLVFTKRVVTGMFLHYISYNLSNPDFYFLFLGGGFEILQFSLLVVFGLSSFVTCFVLKLWWCVAARILHWNLNYGFFFFVLIMPSIVIHGLLKKKEVFFKKKWSWLWWFGWFPELEKSVKCVCGCPIIWFLGGSGRFCNAGLPSDITVVVDDIKFHLHKVGWHLPSCRV
jgi:hypothetical protein